MADEQRLLIGGYWQEYLIRDASARPGLPA